MPQWDSEEVTYGDVTFRIGKLMPAEAKRVFMQHVRPLLGGALKADVEKGADGWKILLAAFTEAPLEHYNGIARALYQVITYSDKSDMTPRGLAGDEENAFKSLDMAHMLLLEGRAFAVNFRGSLDVLQSEFPLLRLAIASLNLPTSTPSSGTPSEQESTA